MIINGDLKLNETNITSIGKLKEVNGYLDLSFCDNLTSLGKLKYVKGLFLNLNFCYSLESLEKEKISNYQMNSSLSPSVSYDTLRNRYFGGKINSKVTSTIYTGTNSNKKY